MARKKAYDEDEVIEKATLLFWKNGYTNSSMRTLEETMGINKFSIYSSFGSKQGVFIKSLQCYKSKLYPLVRKLREAEGGKETIKAFFYDFLVFSKDTANHRGCLLTNTAGELGSDGDPEIMAEIKSFSSNLRAIFRDKLAVDTSKDDEQLDREANYLLIAKQGLSNASKVFGQEAIDDFINITFEHI